MSTTCSPRLLAIIDALPLRPGLRVLEIGCGPGAMAQELARRIEGGFVLGIDRSAKAIQQAKKSGAEEIRCGQLCFVHCAIEDFVLPPDTPRFDIAVAIRVGALDGRHPGLAEAARHRIGAALVPGGPLFIDGGNPLREIPL